MAKAPDNVANPALYAKAKAKAKRKFDVYPSGLRQCLHGKGVQKYGREIQRQENELGRVS